MFSKFTVEAASVEAGCAEKPVGFQTKVFFPWISVVPWLPTCTPWLEPEERERDSPSNRHCHRAMLGDGKAAHESVPVRRPEPRLKVPAK